MYDKVIKLSVLTAPMNSLILQRESSTYEVRPQMNVLMVSPFGSGKTTILQNIEREELGVQIRDYTKAGLLFTITKSGRLVKGSIFRGAKKTILIDEFSRIEPHLRDLLLDLLEEQSTTRSLGVDVMQEYEEKGDGYEIQLRDTWCKIKVKASWIITTMAFRKKRYEDIALMSRCFPVNLAFTQEDAFRLLEGEYAIDMTNVKRLINETKNAIVTIDGEIANMVMKAIKVTLKYTEVPPGYITRMFWDTVRIAAVYSCIDGEYQVSKENVLEACKFLPMQAKGFLSVTLSRAESKVLRIVSENENITTQQIVKQSGMHIETVKRALKRLISMGLVERVQFGKKHYYCVKGEEEWFLKE